MTKYGSQFSGTDTLKRAAGESHNAAARVYKNSFALATDGGTSEPLKIAALAAGDVLDEVLIDTDANLSGITFKIGTPDDDDKYGAAAAGPNATTQTRRVPLALALTPVTEAEDIILTPSGNIPGAGTIVTKVTASHR